MKLRISNQSLRLRVNQDDLNLLMSSGRLDEHFGDESIGKLGYSLLTHEANTISIQLEPSHITVKMPQSYVSEWNSTDRVSFEQNISGIKLLLEKDFQCLSDRPNENESRNFRNPKSQH
jgi:hypothetical protein